MGVVHSGPGATVLLTLVKAESSFRANEMVAKRDAREVIWYAVPRNHTGFNNFGAEEYMKITNIEVFVLADPPPSAVMTPAPPSGAPPRCPRRAAGAPARGKPRRTKSRSPSSSPANREDRYPIGPRCRRTTFLDIRPARKCPCPEPTEPGWTVAQVGERMPARDRTSRTPETPRRSKI